MMLMRSPSERIKAESYSNEYLCLETPVQLRRGVSNGMGCEIDEAQPPTLTQFSKGICSVITKSAFTLLEGMIVVRR